MTTALPQRTLAYKGMVTDTDRWDSFTHRDDDIFICTPEKCGTTWMQTMVAMMVLRTPELDPPATVISPWIDAKMMPLDMMLSMLESQQHRRLMAFRFLRAAPISPCTGIHGTYICPCGAMP